MAERRETGFEAEGGDNWWRIGEAKRTTVNTRPLKNIIRYTSPSQI